MFNIFSFFNVFNKLVQTLNGQCENDGNVKLLHAEI